VQNDTRFPKLSSRKPKPVTVSDVDMRSPGPWGGSEESESEAASSPLADPVTRMVDETSEEDSDFAKPIKVREAGVWDVCLLCCQRC
jgi:hypothetical protein